MNESHLQDSVKADILGAASRPDSVASLWSTYVTPDAKFGDTLKEFYAPTFTMPEMASKTVVYQGDNNADYDYVIIGRLGEGGMGVVFEAEQKHLNRRVALKMIRADKAGDPLARNCFFYEAVIAAGLEHPGIIPVLEFGIDQDRRVFYVMKKASGVPWHRIIHEKSRAENLEILNRISEVVAYAHAQGVIHRDLKPANILLGEYGEVWVCDWGVALRRNTNGEYTHAHPGGTPQYMSPEMARCDAAKLGPRSDVYLLGAILFEIVTGHPPHMGDNQLDTLANAAGNRILPTSQIDGLLRVAYNAMAAIPEQRYADAAEFRKEVKDCIAESEVLALLQRADAQLAAALKNGNYESFQQALADYDAALGVFPGNQNTERGRLKTVLAYARQALANGEYDLALSIVQPEAIRNRAAAALIKTIVEEKKRAIRRPRRFKIANSLIGMLAFVLIIGGAYVYFNWINLTYDTYRHRNRTDSHHYANLYKELDNLIGLVGAVEHNARVQKVERIQQLAKSITTVLQKCRLTFTSPDTATPSGIKHACDYLYQHTDELESLFIELKSMDAHRNATAKHPNQTVSTTVLSFQTLQRHLNQYRQAEGR